MKRKAIIIITCVFLFGFLLLLGFLSAWSEAERNVQVNDIFRKLSICIDIYRNDNNHYPKILLELEANENDEHGKKTVRV